MCRVSSTCLEISFGQSIAETTLDISRVHPMELHRNYILHRRPKVHGFRLYLAHHPSQLQTYVHTKMKNRQQKSSQELYACEVQYHRYRCQYCEICQIWRISRTVLDIGQMRPKELLRLPIHFHFYFHQSLDPKDIHYLLI